MEDNPWVLTSWSIAFVSLFGQPYDFAKKKINKGGVLGVKYSIFLPSFFIFSAPISRGVTRNHALYIPHYCFYIREYTSVYNCIHIDYIEIRGTGGGGGKQGWEPIHFLSF
jgi:hypothetical protein